MGIQINEKPILFSTEMIQAILWGEKTQTRRILKDGLPIGTIWHKVYDGELIYRIVDSKTVLTHCKCPYGKVGDQLWVRECFGKDFFGKIYYKADDLYVPVGSKAKWRPSIHMPRNLSRIQLEITNIKVEQVQDITEEDCIAESIQWLNNGNQNCYQWTVTGKGEEWFDYASDCFKHLWDLINAKRGYGWEKNPFVWAIEFKRI